MIFGYHAQIGVIRTFVGWERGFWHLFAREFWPGSDSNVKRDLREFLRETREELASERHEKHYASIAKRLLAPVT
jgi:hypothetical protein